MSGGLQPFELLYVPKGVPLHLAQVASIVDEEWEKLRHHHVHSRRTVVLAAVPLTVKPDQCEILTGQSGHR